MPFTSSTARLGLVALAGSALCLASCTRESPTSAALRKARSQIQALTPAGAQPASVEHRQKVLSQIKADLAQFPDATPGENASAAVLLSQSQLGLAQLPAAEAAAALQANLHDQARARAVLGKWLTHSSLADTAAKFDPAKELAALDAESQKLDAALAAAQQKKAQIDRQVGGLRTQSQAKAAEARGLQQQAGALKARIPNETAVTGAELLTQARELGRRADRADVEAANLEAEAAKIAPQSTEAQIDIDRLTAQKGLVAQARASVQKRTSDYKAQEQQARADADQVARELADLVQAMETRQGEIRAKTDEAIGGFESAAKSAQKSAAELRSTGNMSLGAARQGAGDASWTLAQSYAALADTLDSISGAPFNPPMAAELKTKSQEARDAAKTALEAATASYEEAFGAYEKAGTGKGEGASAIESLKRSLAANAKKTSGGAKDLAPPAENAPETDPAAQPAAAAAAIEPGTPQATVQAMIDLAKAEQYSQMVDLFHFESAEQKQTMSALFGLAPRFKALENAMKDRFGSDLGDMAAGMGAGMPGLQGLGDAENLKVSDLSFEVTGDTATAKGGGEEVRLRKVDGKWLIEMDMTAMGMPPEQMAMVSGMLPAMGTAVDELTQEVKDGKYPDAQSAMMALMGKLAKAGGMPGMPPGGG